MEFRFLPMAIKNHTPITLIGLLFTLGFAAVPLSKWYDEYAGVGHLLGYELIWWTAVAAVLVYGRLVERRPLASIGFHSPGKADIFVAILAGVVMLAGLAGIYYYLFPALHLSEDKQMNQLMATPFWWRFISVIRAAVGEEVLFRGYAIERTQELTGSVKVAAVLTWAVFTLEHVGPWGWAHLFLAGFGGGILTLLYLWRRNLWVNIIAHFIVDGAAVLLG
jgi:membrane protease YdiL (CAAX protease family)